VTGTVLAAAAALLLWPAPVSRVRRVRPGAGTPAWEVLPGSRRLLPLAAASLAAGVAAVLSTPLVAVLAGGCAALGARSVRAARRRTRDDADLLGLAEGLGVLGAELSAGRPVGVATRTAAASCREGRAATLLSTALREDVGPAGGPVLDRIRAAVRLSGTTGCSLTVVLAAVEDDLRARHRRRLDLRTATAGPRAAAVLLAGLPLLGLAMGSGVGAHPWSVLTTTAAGQVALVAGVLLEVAGVAWVGRLLRHPTAGREPVRGRDG
jgi:tight adherence protein B